MTTLMCTFVLSLSICPLALAQGEGQEDLDKATEAKLDAKSLADLAKVIELCESALKKGLDEGNVEFAKQLLSSTLLQRGGQLTKPIFDRTPPSPQWPQLRILALADLEKAVENDPKSAEALLLIARLNALPGGSEEKAIEAVDKAIAAYGDDAKKQSDAYVLRARMQTDKEKRLVDLNKALELRPDSPEALKIRGLHYIEADKHEEGLKDLEQVLKQNPDDVLAHQAAAEALTSLKKYDEALEHLNKSMDAKEGSGTGFILRARLQALKGDKKAAIEDLNESLKVNPRNIAALLMRAELRGQTEEFDLAKADVDRVLEISPGLPQAILMRSLIFAAQEKYPQAIADLEKLLQADEDNIEIRLQIAAFLVADQRPRKAIDLYTEILADEPASFQALRGRGDAYLSVGKQGDAIKDFEAAYKIDAESSGLLNNLAWVLATCPDDNLRDGKRAIELGTKACELTEYKAAHILSTLASAYAETGDWENALKWSNKAVELGEDDVKEQLKQELKSYEEKKPWREAQNVEEKPEPPKAEDGDLEL